MNISKYCCDGQCNQGRDCPKRDKQYIDIEKCIYMLAVLLFVLGLLAWLAQL